MIGAVCFADPAHQGLEHPVQEDEDDADEGDAHKSKRALKPANGGLLSDIVPKTSETGLAGWGAWIRTPNPETHGFPQNSPDRGNSFE